MNAVKPLVALNLLVMLVLGNAAYAAESFDNCTGFIDSLPATISTQGTWCLRKDLATSINSGNAITITNNNVTVDCNDFKLGGLAAGFGTQATGIYGHERLNTTIRHCNVRGFQYGVKLFGSGGGGHTVEDNLFNGNTYIGVHVQGDGSVVQQNRVVDTGGSLVDANAYGITTGYSVDVLGNTVSGVISTSGSNGTATGINTDLGSGMSITSNRVSGLLADGSGIARGIYYNASSGRGVLRDNDVVGNGASGSYGVMCGGTTARLKDNVILGFQVAVDGCGDAGGNDTTF